MNPPLPSAGTVDPWPEILHLIPQKIRFKGAAVQGDPTTLRGFGHWLIQQLPAVVGDGDPESKANCFLLWLRAEQQYEADDATRMHQQAAVATAPQNPISDQTAPQQAQLAAAPTPAPAEEAATGDGVKCLECGATCKSITGLKKHLTVTHKVDWAVYCHKHGLDNKTGAKIGAAPAAAAPAAPVAPPPPPPASPVPPMFQAQGAATAMPSFAAPASGPFVPPAPPPTPTGSPQQHTIPFTTAGQMPQPPPQQPAPPPIVGSSPAPFVAPASPGPMVAFNPNQVSQPAFTPPGPFVGPGVAPQQQAASAPAPVQLAPIAAGAPTREALAQMLGGPVDLIVVRLLDAANVKLDGRVDVNQLAMLAETRARSEMKVNDLAQASYGQGKQAAQRHFADLLSQHPNCYLLQNGYDPIIPDGYLAILSSRVVRFHVATDNGRQITTIF